MKLHRILWNIGAALALLLMTTSAALAQRDNGDSGQYRILQALYGTAERSVDVTERLKELARQDQSFRLDNNLFGVDPDEGRVKTLRIHARGPGGASRMFEYREGSIVDGAQFSGWRGGEWGQGGGAGGWNGDAGQYRILQALYGTARRNVDVTERLKELARQDQSFRIENSVFGADPDEGRVKTLRIYARGPDGANRMFEYREGGVVDGSQFSGWRGGDWGQGGWNGGWGGSPAELSIIRATYGTGRRQLDVTERMRILASDGRLQLRVSNHSAGGDPAPGMPKSLRVTYSVGGRQQQVRVEEGGQLDIP